MILRLGLRGTAEQLGHPVTNRSQSEREKRGVLQEKEAFFVWEAKGLSLSTCENVALLTQQQQQL